MSENLLKIPLSRFEPGKAFALDVFLHLALNGRYVRVVCAGDDISPDLLARLGKKGVSALFVATDGQGSYDPETFPIYAVPAISPSPVPAEAAPPPVAEVSPAEQALAVSQATEEQSQTFSATPVEKPEEVLLSGSSEKQNDLVTVKGSSEKPDESLTTFAAGGAETEDSLTFSHTAEGENEGALLLARLKSALILEKLSLEAANFRKIVSAAPLKERKKFRREFTTLFEASERANSNRIDASMEKNFPVASELEKFQALATAEATPELLVRASDRVVEALSTSAIARKSLKECDRLITEAEAFRESPALQKLGKKLAAAPKDEQEKIALIQDVKNSIMVNKISEEILKFSAAADEKEEEQHFSPELASLERALETVSGGGTLPKEVENRFSADQEAEELVTVFSSAEGEAEGSKKISDHIKVAADRRDQAMQELQSQRTDGSLVRAKNHRDLPATASRLAAYLGYSLGYSNLDLLSDLALAAILHFARKEEDVRLSEQSIPPFAQRILSKKADANFVIEDAQEIIQIIDAYLSHPECDREQKDFVKRVFDRTLEMLAEDSQPLDAVNLAKWSKFVEKGADLTGHSICVKASASAIKQSRSLII